MTEHAKGLRRTDDGDPFNAGWNAALDTFDAINPEIARLREDLSAVALEYSTKFFDQGAEIARLRAERDNREMLFEMAKKDVEKLLAQRGQLVAALKDLVSGDDLQGAMHRAHAAIAAVEDCR